MAQQPLDTSSSLQVRPLVTHLVAHSIASCLEIDIMCLPASQSNHKKK